MNLIYIVVKHIVRHLASPKIYAKFMGAKIGDNCLIDTKHWPSESYLIEIGNQVQVTENVYFHTHGGAHTARRLYPDFDVFGKIKIGDWAYIGSNSHIMPGVKIGEGALIAAGSIVTKSVPPNELWGGCPAKFICTVEQYIQRNLRYNTGTKGKTRKQKRKILLSASEEKFIEK